MAKYKYTDLERALVACHYYQVNNNGGSHQKYVQSGTGLMQPMPKHSNGIVAPGTAESILDWVILGARILNINIVSDKYKLTDDIKNYVIKRHAEIGKNLASLIPSSVKKELKIETEAEVKAYVKKLLQMGKEYRLQHQKEFEFDDKKRSSLPANKNINQL